MPRQHVAIVDRGACGGAKERNIGELGKLQAKQDLEDDKLSKENAAKKTKLTKQQELEEAVRLAVGAASSCSADVIDDRRC